MSKPKAKQNKAEQTETRKMKLNIGDRLRVVNHLIPQEGDIVTLTIAKDISSKAILSQEEIKKGEVEGAVTDGKSQLKWGKDFTKTIEFTNAELELLRTQVALLDKQKKVTSELLDICIRIRN